MAGLPLVDPESADGETAGLFAAAHQVLGVTPNLVKVMANSPAVLKAYLDSLVALRGGVLSAATRHRIALLVAQEHECDYCLSIHTYLGTKVAGLTAGEAARARRGQADTATATAGLALATALIRNRGSVTDGELAAARHAGLSDAAIAEVVAHVAVSAFATYLAKVGQVEVDWPLVHHTEKEKNS